MKKIYRLKPWGDVKNHHFVSEDNWDTLANYPSLNVESLGGFMTETVLISPANAERTFSNTFLVDKSDLIEIEEKPVKKTANKPANATEKTYTKDDVRRAGMRVVEDIESEETAVASALAIAKLINELN